MSTKRRKPCSSGKIRYGTRWAAREAFYAIVIRGSKRHSETRIYRCHECGGFHLTSRVGAS